jgi:hypothetical protein
MKSIIYPCKRNIIERASTIDAVRADGIKIKVVLLPGQSKDNRPIPTILQRTRLVSMIPHVFMFQLPPVLFRIRVMPDVALKHFECGSKFF